MRTVTVAELKNNLSRYLREARRGERFTVLSRDVPVARLVPLDPPRPMLDVRPPRPDAPPPGRSPLPPPLPGLDRGADVVELLLAERGER